MPCTFAYYNGNDANTEKVYGQEHNGQEHNGQEHNGQEHNGQEHNGQEHNGYKVFCACTHVLRVHTQNCFKVTIYEYMDVDNTCICMC